MKIEIKDLRDETSKYVGKKLWVCDYRRPDLHKKTVRHIKPQQMLLRSNADTPNKRIYYTDTHFVALNKKGDPIKSKITVIFDNTGYRSYAGIPINVFDNEQECKDFYVDQANIIADLVDEKIKTTEQYWKTIAKDIRDNIYFNG